jgi:hypothetical protein
MTSMTSPQQTDRSGADEIPGPRGGQGVRLLVLGTYLDAQELRERAQAAGYELAQRYSARVSHVAYGSGIDPADARYTKIRDAGLPLLPLQKCAEALGLWDDAVETETETGHAAVEPAEAAVDAEVAQAEVAEAAFEVEVEIDDEPLDFPPLRTSAEVLPDEAAELLYDQESATSFVPGFAEDEPLDVPLAAAVLGVDPWVGEQETEEPIGEAADDPADAPTGTPEPGGIGRVLLSVVWALIPLATFGLLSPVTFGYAAYRLHSRRLALTALVYTFAVVLAFVLSAIRPHAVTPSDASGALLTICLAGTWIGGTLHALSLRTRVFAR